jgi:hypothetical protein
MAQSALFIETLNNAGQFKVFQQEEKKIQKQ